MISALDDKNNTASTETASLLPARVNSDLDRVLTVKQIKSGEFQSWAESLVDLPAGALFARIEGVERTSKPTWSSVQAGRDLHIELQSNLVYINHSCVPNLEMDMERMEVRVSRSQDLKKGDKLTFFYPSTEFRMAQPFDCWCNAGEGVCLGRITGAESVDPAKLDGYWINGYIKEMLEEVSKKKSHL
ncbi:hypothetical protein F5Y08DRAFT_311814 [Xylaria arbuscula]|nr:hypothetical protein F5Y08DRAFT_311814 [Xylaria arbuscula]